MGISRRGFLEFTTGAALAGVLFALFKARHAQALPRPPGALAEADFLAFCSRCTRCIDACLPFALHPAGLFQGVVNVGTPVLDVNRCVLCMECVRKCPTGALKKVPKQEIDLGTAEIDRKRCLAWLNKKRCKNCYKKCPTHAIFLEKGRYPMLNEEKCNTCGICVRSCPTSPKSVVLVYRGAVRFERPARRFSRRLEDRVGPYDFPPPDFGTWFANRVRSLLEHYGLTGKNRKTTS